MWDILQGIIAILLVLLLFSMRESENKWITFFGWEFFLAKILH